MSPLLVWIHLLPCQWWKQWKNWQWVEEPLWAPSISQALKYSKPLTDSCLCVWVKSFTSTKRDLQWTTSPTLTMPVQTKPTLLTISWVSWVLKLMKKNQKPRLRMPTSCSDKSHWLSLTKRKSSTSISVTRTQNSRIIQSWWVQKWNPFRILTLSTLEPPGSTLSYSSLIETSKTSSDCLKPSRPRWLWLLFPLWSELLSTLEEQTSTLSTQMILITLKQQWTTSMDLCSTLWWWLGLVQSTILSCSSLKRDLFSWEKWTTICTLPVRTSLEKSFLNSQQVSCFHSYMAASNTLLLSIIELLHTTSLSTVIWIVINPLVGILFFLYLTAGSYALIIGTLVSDR